MIMFWIIALAMVVIALIFLLRPLLHELNKKDIDREAQNISITKERLNELKVELEQETITAAEYEQTKEELEQALLNDVEVSNRASAIVNPQSFTRTARYIVIISVPVLALGLYTVLGQPDLIEGGKKQASAVPAGHGSAAKGNAGLGSIDEMLEKLKAKLKQNPNNAEGWFLLARSYMSMNRYEEAVVALEKTNQLVPNTPVVMLRYADALTMLNGGKISGKPFELIKKAVVIKPDDPTGLWLIGMGYAEQGDFQKAISYWNLLLPLLKDDKSINEVHQLIRQAKSKSGIALADESKTTSTLPKNKAITSLKVKVSIDPSMLKNVSMNDTVFIFAKAVNGPPMPLAVVRKKVKDLPLDVILDDSMAMIPSMKLSSFDKVKVTARVSRTGKPLLQKGDIYSKEKQIGLPYKGLVIIKIDSVAD